jgi:hypothetical protein
VAADSETMSLTRRSSSSAPFLTDSSESAASYSQVSHARVPWYSTHLAECIEDLVKVDEDLAFRDLGNVVHALARIVSNPRILIGEACEDGGYDFFEVARDFLQHPSAQSGAPRAAMHTGPKAIEAAASPMSPPFLAWGWWTAYAYSLQSSCTILATLSWSCAFSAFRMSASSSRAPLLRLS